MKIKNLLLALALLCLVPLAITAKDKYSNVDEYHSIVMSFAKGEHILSSADMSNLKTVLRSVREKGSISKVEVAAWSDREHLATANLPKMERDLAYRRLQTVKNALKKNIGSMNYIGLYNMAENANWVGRFFHSSEAELDAVFAKKETGALERQEFTILKREGAPSKAIVVLKVRKK